MWSLILPFHSDFRRLHRTLALLKGQTEPRAIGEVLLCHNGARLDPEAERGLGDLAAEHGAACFHTDSRGVGAGYKLGILNSAQPYCLLSASDLPFGLSDLDSFSEHVRKRRETPSLALGSKGHCRSIVGTYPARRRVASWVFYLLRRILLGRDTPRDAQGTIMVATALARELAPRCRSNDYFFSVELITLAQRRGVQVVELPVRIGPQSAESSVSLVRDGWRMVGRLVELSRRLGAG